MPNEVSYIERLPDNPPPDIIDWLKSKGAFNNSDFIIFKQGWQENEITGKKKKAASCICTACGKAFFADWINTECSHCHDYGIGLKRGRAYETHRNGAQIICPYCEKTAKLYHVSNFKRGYDFTKYVAVPSANGDDFIITTYIATKRIYDNGAIKYFCNEYEAYLFSKKKVVRFRHYQRFMSSFSWLIEWQQLKQFSDTSGYMNYWYPGSDGKGTCIENARLEQYRKAAGNSFLPVSYLRLFLKRPHVENLITIGAARFIALAIEKEEKATSYYNPNAIRGIVPVLKFVNWRKKSPYKMLGLNRVEMKAFVRLKNEALEDLEKLIKLRAYGVEISEDGIQLLKQVLAANVTELIACGEPVSKVLMYLAKQKTDFIFLRDYWAMAAQLQLDMENALVKYPRNLMYSHNYVQERVKETITAADKKAFARIFKELQPLTYSHDKYFIIPAKSPELLKTEGKALSHCVGTYGKSHCKYKSIFFIRKADAPDAPYFTLQLDVKKKSVLQNRGKYNCAPPQVVKDFVDEWLKNKVYPFNIKKKKRSKTAIQADTNRILQLTA